MKCQNLQGMHSDAPQAPAERLQQTLHHLYACDTNAHNFSPCNHCIWKNKKKLKNWCKNQKEETEVNTKVNT